MGADREPKPPTVYMTYKQFNIVIYNIVIDLLTISLYKNRLCYSNNNNIKEKILELTEGVLKTYFSEEQTSSYTCYQNKLSSLYLNLVSILCDSKAKRCNVNDKLRELQMLDSKPDPLADNNGRCISNHIHFFLKLLTEAEEKGYFTIEKKGFNEVDDLFKGIAFLSPETSVLAYHKSHFLLLRKELGFDNENKN